MFLNPAKKRCVGIKGNVSSSQMNRAKVDEEEYWHSSKCKAFTFDDEDDELFQVQSIV